MTPQPPAAPEDTPPPPATPPRPAQRRRAALHAAGTVAYCAYVLWLADLTTGGQLSRAVTARIRHTRRRLAVNRRTVEPTATMLSALHTEARRITEEAARAQPRPTHQP